MVDVSIPWMRRITQMIKESREIPMWGTPPKFPWDEVISEFKARFYLDDISIQISKAEWKVAEDLLKGLGIHLIPIKIVLSPIEEAVFWVMPLEDMRRMTKWISKDMGTFSDNELCKGYYHYLLLEVCDILHQKSAFHDLTIQLAEDALPSEDCYVLDVSVSHHHEHICGRILFSTSFQRRYKEHFAQKMDLISSPLSSHLDMTLSLIAGRVLLTQKEFNEIHQGDFVLLDFCSFAPDTKKGTFSLALGNMPLFQVKLREEKIKILDFSNYYEAIHMHESTDEEIKSYDEETIEPEPEEERSYLLEKEEKMVQPQNIPLNITVEVAKIKMSLDRLLQLRPGNVLELAVRPEQGVLLTVEGNPIARGQLLQVGEMIGVKILSIHD